MTVDLPTMPSLRLDGRRALVTGAGGGLGLACGAAGAPARPISRAMARPMPRWAPVTRTPFPSSGNRFEVKPRPLMVSRSTNP